MLAGRLSAEYADRICFDLISGCWLWVGHVSVMGYARYGSRKRYAHRLIYEALVGPIPAGMELDHLCRAHRCVNPSHLEVVTHRENILRGRGPAAAHARKTECVNGHPFDAANTYSWGPEGRYRSCRTCDRERHRAM